jgi:type II secretory pathway component PulC
MNAHRLHDINFILLCLTFVLVILLVYQIFRPLDISVTDEKASPERITQFPNLESRQGDEWASQDYDNIVEMNLFSSQRTPPSSRAKTVSREDGEGTVSYEGLELIGTVISDEERSFALIRKGGIRGEVKSYQQRDDIEGIELSEIFYDRVILSKNGKEIVLLLEPRELERQTNIPPSQKSMERRQKKTAPQQGGQQSWTPQQRKD